MSSYLMEPVTHRIDLQPNAQQNNLINTFSSSEFSTFYHNTNQDQDQDQEDDYEDEDDDLDEEEEEEDQEEEGNTFEESNIKRVEEKAGPPATIVPLPDASNGFFVPNKVNNDRESNGSTPKKESIPAHAGNESTTALSSKTVSPVGSKKLELNSVSPPAASESNPMELLRENRSLRKKVEVLMKHNMQLMVGIKDRDHKIYKQKQLLSKYRKALLRFFEDNESSGSSSSSDSELSGIDVDEQRTQNTSTGTASCRQQKNLLPPAFPSPTSSPISSPTPTIPSPIADATLTQERQSVDIDDTSSSTNGDAFIYSEFYANPNKKRKAENINDLNGKPEKKKKGTRRNTLWSPEDDELFTKVYNVYGKSWKTIHTFMPDKTREQVQSHGQYLIRIGKLEDIKSAGRRGRKPKTVPPQNDTPQQ